MAFSIPSIVATGDIVTAAFLNQLVANWAVVGGEWTVYTPTLTADTGTVSVGSGGSVAGAYIQLGKLVICRFSVLWGSTGMSVGTGSLHFGLPATSKATATNLVQTGPAMILNEGVAWYDAKVFINTSSSSCQIQYMVNGSAGNPITLGFVSGTAPFAFGNTDKINAGPFIYQTA